MNADFEVEWNQFLRYLNSGEVVLVEELENGWHFYVSEGMYKIMSFKAKSNDPARDFAFVDQYLTKRNIVKGKTIVYLEEVEDLDEITKLPEVEEAMEEFENDL